MLGFLHFYSAELVRVIDGDTIVVNLDLGFAGLMARGVRIRLLGIDTPEIRGDSKEFGDLVKGFVEDVLPSDLVVKLYKRDSFGRVLGRVYFKYEDSWEDLSSLLLRLGYGVVA